MTYRKRWHIEILLRGNPRHGEIASGLSAGGLDWIITHKALIRRLAAAENCQSEMEYAIRQDLALIEVSAEFLSQPTNHAGADLWPSGKPREAGKPRIGFLSSSYMPIGGTETFHRSLIPRLLSSVDVAGFVATGFVGGDGAKLAVPYATGVKAARRLAACCDVVVSWGIQDLQTLLPVDRPKVIAVHHADFTNEWSNRTILDQLSLIDQIVCVNENTAERLSEHGKPTHFIPNAIDPQRLIPSGNQFGLRFQFDIAQDSKIVLFGHRLSSEKRPLLAVTIAKHLPNDWTLVIVGDGPERESVERMAAGCDRVRFVGPSDSLADWLSISDCFLSLSTFEGFGLSIAEAIAAGVPTVSTPAGIAPGHATTLPTDSTASEWAAAIVNARPIMTPETILDQFSVARMVGQWAELLNSSS